MPHHFHDVNGWYIVGIDVHEGLHIPTPPAPVKNVFFEVNALHPFAMGGNQAAKTMFNGVAAVKDQHNPKLLWPHFPVFPWPINLLFPLDLLMGNHKTWLSRGSVQIEGSAGPVCAILGPLSVNIDCWAAGHVPSSLIFQAGTVETTPSIDDYNTCIVRYEVQSAVEAAYYAAGKAISGGSAAPSVMEEAITPAESAEAAASKTITDALVDKINPVSDPAKGTKMFTDAFFDAGAAATGRGDGVKDPRSPMGVLKALFGPASAVDGNSSLDTARQIGEHIAFGGFA